MKHSNELSSDAMSTLGTKWKFQSKLRMSAFRGKADMSLIIALTNSQKAIQLICYNCSYIRP